MRGPLKQNPCIDSGGLLTTKIYLRHTTTVEAHGQMEKKTSLSLSKNALGKWRMPYLVGSLLRAFLLLFTLSLFITSFSQLLSAFFFQECTKLIRGILVCQSKCAPRTGQGGRPNKKSLGNQIDSDGPRPRPSPHLPMWFGSILGGGAWVKC